MSNTPPPDKRPHSLGSAVERLRHRWGWIVAYGCLNAALGVVALVLTEMATIASVLMIGLFIMVAGVIEIVIGSRMRTWGRLFLWETAGILYLLAGLFAVVLPELASVVITLLLGAGLIATGMVRIYLGMRMTGTRSRAGIVVAGLVTAFLGLFIVLQWPNSSTFVLGTFLGIDLVVYGLTWIILGSRLAKHHNRSSRQ
jgi:uncharacterized membrane protein HdeD (DUF308 family)